MSKDGLTIMSSTKNLAVRTSQKVAWSRERWNSEENKKIDNQYINRKKMEQKDNR